MGYKSNQRCPLTSLAGLIPPLLLLLTSLTTPCISTFFPTHYGGDTYPAHREDPGASFEPRPRSVETGRLLLFNLTGTGNTFNLTTIGFLTLVSGTALATLLGGLLLVSISFAVLNPPSGHSYYKGHRRDDDDGASSSRVTWWSGRSLDPSWVLRKRSALYYILSRVFYAQTIDATMKNS